MHRTRIINPRNLPTTRFLFLVCACISAFKFMLINRKLDEITGDFGGFWRSLTNESQLRWVTNALALLSLFGSFTCSCCPFSLGFQWFRSFPPSNIYQFFNLQARDRFQKSCNFIILARARERCNSLGGRRDCECSLGPVGESWKETAMAAVGWFGKTYLFRFVTDWQLFRSLKR
jgi:hypothetical protein